MRILAVTGRRAEHQVRKAVARSGIGVDVLVLDVEIAAFITPRLLTDAKPQDYDLILLPGAITADFSGAEAVLRSKIRLGPKHAVDLSTILKHLDDVELSVDTPACVLLAEKISGDARSALERLEAKARPGLVIKGVKVGGESRMKVLAEVVDATLIGEDELTRRVAYFDEQGADMIDLGIPLNAAAEAVARAVTLAVGATDLPVSVDTTQPELIAAGVESGADMVLSLDGRNIPLVAEAVADAGVPAVVIPGPGTLRENVDAALTYGIDVIADPVLNPPMLGMVDSITDYLAFKEAYPDMPLFFGVGNVTELLDADSVGANALLAAMATEIKASILFTPEYSDKARGSVRELRLASEMMALALERKSPPKDLGIDLLILKEKRRRPKDPATDYEAARTNHPVQMDPAGSFRIGVRDGKIIATGDEISVAGTSAKDVLNTLIDRGGVTRLDHAGYLGRELARAEIALMLDRSYDQDDNF